MNLPAGSKKIYGYSSWTIHGDGFTGETDYASKIYTSIDFLIKYLNKQINKRIDNISNIKVEINKNHANILPKNWMQLAK